jgi:hypothetical protein
LEQKASSFARLSSEGQIQETHSFPYPIYFQRVSGAATHTRYWVLYSEAPTEQLLRQPASLDSSVVDFSQAWPVALMRDDNGDSQPDVAILFYSSQEEAQTFFLDRKEEEGLCTFWEGSRF